MADTERIPCGSCGSMILPATGKRTGGLCMPCFQRPEIEASEARYQRNLNDPQLLDWCAMFVDTSAHSVRDAALNRFRERYQPLVDLLIERGLFVEPEKFSKINDWYEFELRKSDLKPQGLAIFDHCYAAWMESCHSGADVNQSQEVWHRAFEEISKESNT